MANIEFEHEIAPRIDELIEVGKRIASALEVVAGVVDEIYKEQQDEQRTKTVSAREVTKVASAPAPPRVPRARAQL